MDSAPSRQENKSDAGTASLGFLRLYLITDRSLVLEARFLEAVESALEGGLLALQLREKDLAPRELLPLAQKLRTLTRAYGARLFINDRVDIAQMVQADGVHLTEASVSPAEVKRIAPDLLTGVSTHSLQKAQAAEAEGADFITFSPVYATPSKAAYGPPQGLDRLQEVCSTVRLPVLALGGIHKGRINAVLDRGAFGIALISGIWNSSDIKNETFEYMQSLERR